MASGSRGRLRLLPSQLYVLKAAAVRARSVAWHLRGGGRDAPARGLRILAYHRVSDDVDALAVSRARFSDQMAWLASEGYRVVDLAEAAESARRGDALHRTVALTFDDGYRDVAEHGLPVLERHGFEATVFLVPGAIDGDVRFEWYERQPPLLGWDEARRLAAAGPLRFGAHTLTHPNLLTLDERTARREIAGSKAILERRLGRPIETFCYPAGLFAARERALVEEAGYRAAVSCEPGVVAPGADPLSLCRMMVDARDSLLDFRAKLGGAHDRPFPLRALHRRLRYGAPARPRPTSSER